MEYNFGTSQIPNMECRYRAPNPSGGAKTPSRAGLAGESLAGRFIGKAGTPGEFRIGFASRETDRRDRRYCARWTESRPSV